MKWLNSCKIMIGVAAVALSSHSIAGTIVVDGQKLKSYEEIDNYFYGIFSSHMSNAITSKTITKLELEKLNGKFVFVSPKLDTWRERYIWVGGGLNKPGNETQMMIGYSEKVRSEMVFYYFEKMGLVDHMDVVEETGFSDEIEKNYDYVITMRSDFDGKRDAKSANSRKTEFFVRHVKTGRESKVTDTIGSPVLVPLFETVAVKFSDAVKELN